MTTDVIGSITDRSPALPLKIPAWVPTSIADFAQEVLAKQFMADPSDPILARLLVDPRMRTVWTQLTRKRRLDGRFLHPARLDRVAEASARQDSAMRLLFCLAFRPFMVGELPAARPRRDVDKIRTEAKETARKLREEAANQEAVEQYNRLVRAKRLEDAAEALDEIAAEAETRCIIVDRDRGNLAAHGLAMWIAENCEWLFGSPLYSVTATMTSVALDCEVSTQQVRDWWRATKRE